MAEIVNAVGAASSFLSLAKAAWKLGQALNKLYHDTQNVNKTVWNLSSDTKALGDISRLVCEQLRDIINAPGSTYDQDGKLWESVRAEVKECLETIYSLQRIVDDVERESSHFLGQVNRQLTLNRKSDELQNMRQRIGVHMVFLQTILHLVNIQVSHLAPKLATETLLPKLDDFGTQLQVLQSTVDEIKRQGTSPQAGDSLVACAQDVMRSGQLLYEASVADGSIKGGSGGADSNVRVAAWVGTLELLHDSSTRDPSSRPSSIFSDINKGTVASTETPYTAEDGDEQQKDEHVSEEHEYDATLARAALKEGALAFKDSQWHDANEMLQEALLMLQNLPSKSRAFCDTFELQYQLAVCAYHLEDPAIAEESLSSLASQMPTNTKQRIIVCDAKFLLARLYVRVGELDLAKASCHAAGEGRKSFCGKEHDSYLEALALSSRICQLLGNSARARIIQSLVPDTRREAVFNALDALLATDSSMPNTSSTTEEAAPPLPPRQSNRSIEQSALDTAVVREENDSPVDVRASADQLSSKPIGEWLPYHGLNRLKSWPEITAKSHRELPIQPYSQSLTDIGSSVSESRTSIDKSVNRKVNESAASDEGSLQESSVMFARLSSTQNMQRLSGNILTGMMRSMRNTMPDNPSTRMKIRYATSSSNIWGPSSSEMSEIARLTHKDKDCSEIIKILHEKLTSKSSTWRHVLKSMKVLRLCLYQGSERIVVWARDNIHIFHGLRKTTAHDNNGPSIASQVREFAKNLIALVEDENFLRSERSNHGLRDG